MSTASLIVAIFAGTLGCGFFFAGILMLREFPDSDKKTERGRLIAELLDGIFLFGAVTTAHDAARNWSRRDARRFIYAGFGSLLLMSAALYFR